MELEGLNSKELIEINTESTRDHREVASRANTSQAKSSHRMHYDAQVEVIKKQVGDLETIRSQLGLTQRKISQLLMVDPSAWTRWTRKNEAAPPHIFRALQWYMILQEKIPGLTPQYFVGPFTNRDRTPQNQAVLDRLESLEAQNSALLTQKQELETKMLKLETQIQANRVGFFMVVLGALIMAAAIFWRLRPHG